MLRHVWTLALAGALTMGCGSDSSSGSKSDGGTDNGTDSGTKTDSGADVCLPDQAQDYGDCAEAEVKAYAGCIETACADTYAECYGANYKQGQFSGPCADYLTCASKCDCNDTNCITACTPSSACTSCQQGFVSCALGCSSKLQCAYGADSGIPDLSKTCKDMLTCCNSLSDASAKQECTAEHDQYAAVGATGDLACAATISSYCP